MQLKGGQTTQDPRLDRVVQFDKRSRKYPISAVVHQEDRPELKYWMCEPRLNQGKEGACVGFAWSHELGAEPFEVSDLTDDFARSIYSRAQKIDEWPGESYSGTSVLAGAKIVKSDGYIGGYRWAFSFDEFLDALTFHGPAVLGVNWYDSMYSPNKAGFVAPTGKIVGGHAILSRGVNYRRELVVFRNSWGQGWGKNGDCYMTFDSVRKLLDQDGEVCVPVDRSLGVEEQSATRQSWFSRLFRCKR